MPTMGLLKWAAAMDPWKTASPKENSPPSEATSQYPWPVAVAAIPITGLFRGCRPIEP